MAIIPVGDYTPITLDDLGVVPVKITVKTSYGREILIQVKPLTCAQWTEIGAEVQPPPEPPQKNPATLLAWEKHKARAEEERLYRRVIFALEQGGNPIPGGSTAEKVENWRRSVDQGISNSIAYFLAGAAFGDKATVESDAAAFQPSDGVDSSDV